MIKKLIIALLFIIAFLLLFFFGNKSNPEINVKGTNGITISYSFNSYLQVITEKANVEKIVKHFDGLKLRKTNKKLDLATTFIVNFTKKGKGFVSVWVDYDGVFRINGSRQGYELVSGSFNYKGLKEIYDNREY